MKCLNIKTPKETFIIPFDRIICTTIQQIGIDANDVTFALESNTKITVRFVPDSTVKSITTQLVKA